MRRSKRSSAERAITEAAAVQRASRQSELMKKKLAEARKKLKKGGDDDAEEEIDLSVTEMKTYKSTEEYPRDVLPNQVKVDLSKEALILPIDGQPVPFHVSTIKTVSRPDEDQATWMRVNFVVPGSTTKDVPKNMQNLLVKYGDQMVFIKEMTFRSLNPNNLNLAYQQFQELRKRIKAREMKAEQEKDLVVQEKLVRIRDQRVPRLMDLTMRPNIR